MKKIDVMHLRSSIKKTIISRKIISRTWPNGDTKIKKKKNSPISVLNRYFTKKHLKQYTTTQSFLLDPIIPFKTYQNTAESLKKKQTSRLKTSYSVIKISFKGINFFLIYLTNIFTVTTNIKRAYTISN